MKGNSSDEVDTKSGRGKYQEIIRVILQNCGHILFYFRKH